MYTHIYTHKYIHFLHLRGIFGQWASSPGQLALSVSMVLSNQHIPLSLDRHRQTILAARTQGGVTLISCPLTSDYTRTHSHCTVLLMLTLKTPHSCTQNIQLFLCFEAAVTVTLSTQSPRCLSARCQPQSQCGRASPRLLLCPHTNTDSPLSVLMTLPPSFHPSLPPSGHHLDTRTRL